MSIIAENWKTNPLMRDEARALFDLNAELAENAKSAEIIICAPFVFLEGLAQKPRPHNLKIGAQNCFWEEKGAYTGEISPFMLKNLGCEYVILGHSERREFLKEIDEMINKKIAVALHAGLKVIFCVGEKERDENGNYLSFLSGQIKEGLLGASLEDLKNIIVAYEPVWAISANASARSDTVEDLAKTVVFIKKVLADIFYETAQDIKIIYGGSVSKENFKNFLGVPEISGLLIGSASLNPEEIKEILCSI